VTKEHLAKPELLTRKHRVNGFDCGEPDINRFLIHDALAQAEAGFSQTWVIATDHMVQGYVSLTAASQPVRVKQGGTSKKLLTGILGTCPYPDAPMVMLGRLGRRTEQAKSGVGKRLLIFAIVKVVRLSEEIGIAGIVLDAMTDDLLSYYRKMKFERLPYPDTRKRRMLLTMADAKATIAAV
jgi:hypothetical protein